MRKERRREGKSLGEWFREAADEKLASARPRRFTVEELREFNAKCDAMHPPGEREMDWEDMKRIIMDSKIAGLDDI